MGRHHPPRTPSHPPTQEGGSVNAELLIELLEEYAADMRRRGKPWASVDHLEHTRNIILRDAEGQK
jgi:hypothetical protein